MNAKYPFHNTFLKKCPKCGGGVEFNIKKKPYGTEEGWSGYCEYCKEFFAYNECGGFPPVHGSGASKSGGGK
jgi:hypothetical protein